MREMDAADPPRITWLASYAKSGNTWVRLFLTRLLLGDAWTMNHARPLIPNMLDFVRATKPWTPQELGDPAVIQQVASTWIPTQSDIRRNWRPDHRGALLLKTHNALVDIGGASFTSSEQTEKAVYILRDPRDVLTSLAHHLDWPLPRACDLMLNRTAHVVTETDYLPEFWGSWGVNVMSWSQFNRRALLTLRYEDLHADGAGRFRALVDFLGWTVHEADFDAALAAVEFRRLQNTERETSFGEAVAADRPFFRRGVVGGWRDHPEQDQFRRIEDAFGPEMAAFGYS